MKFRGINYDRLAVGQRVIARFNPSNEPRFGVVSGEKGASGWPVQFGPCGSHWVCAEVSCHGDAGGWTEKEYRIERESATTLEHAAAVEAERREHFPDAAFSAYRGEAQ